MVRRTARNSCTPPGSRPTLMTVYVRSITMTATASSNSHITRAMSDLTAWTIRRMSRLESSIAFCHCGDAAATFRAGKLFELGFFQEHFNCRVGLRRCKLASNTHAPVSLENSRGGFSGRNIAATRAFSDAHAILHFWIAHVRITRCCLKDLQHQLPISAVLTECFLQSAPCKEYSPATVHRQSLTHC